MKKITLWDKTYFIVSDEQAAAIERKLSGTAMFRVLAANKMEYIVRPSTVMKIEQARGEEVRDLLPPAPVDHQIAAPPIDPARARKDGESLHDWFHRIGKGNICHCKQCWKKRKEERAAQK